jgi:imidazolonepropionase-like amidohydrolase
MDGEADLPRLVRCGQHVARRRRYLPHLAIDVEPGELAREAVRQCKAGDGWVKLVGDWIDRDMPEPDLLPLWPTAELAAAVAAVHAEGGRVTTHVFSRRAAADALEAGVDCVEHGCGMDEALMARAADTGTPVVPTMLQRRNFAEIADAGRERFPLWAGRFDRMYAEREAQARALCAAGVPLLAGSDQGTSIPHGSLPAELIALVEAGIPAPVAVGAATWNARRFLGHEALSEGSPADLVFYERDPRVDITALARPTSIVLRGMMVGRG